MVTSPLNSSKSKHKTETEDKVDQPKPVNYDTPQFSIDPKVSEKIRISLDFTFNLKTIINKIDFTSKFTNSIR